MKQWIKNKFKMTPKRRLDIAYWLGTFQAILIMSIFQSLADNTMLPMPVILPALAVWLLIGFLYIKNSIDFSKETLWMSIKNPAKVNIEASDSMLPNSLKVGTGALKRQNPTNSPNRPPPPPRPPAPRNVGP